METELDLEESIFILSVGMLRAGNNHSQSALSPISLVTEGRDQRNFSWEGICLGYLE